MAESTLRAGENSVVKFLYLYMTHFITKGAYEYYFIVYLYLKEGRTLEKQIYPYNISKVL